jgi:hypothetical protein
MNSIAQEQMNVSGEIQALALEFMHEGLPPILAYTRAAGQVDGLLTWAGERVLCGSVWRVAEGDMDTLNGVTVEHMHARARDEVGL